MPNSKSYLKMVVDAVVTSSIPSEADLKEMEKLMSDGKVNLVRKQPHLALDSFVELCEKLSTWHGQESDKCVEAYLYYGRTLLDIARIENGVLGHAIKELPVFGTETENEETEKEDTEKENTEDEGDGSVAPLNPIDRKILVESAMRDDNLYNPSTDDQTEDEEEEEVFDGKDKAEKTPVESEAKEKEDSKAAAKEGDDKVSSTSVSTEEAMKTEEAASSSTAEQTKDQPGDETSAGGASASMDVDEGIDVDDNNEDEDDVTNLELAWEMFELIVKICRKQLTEGGCDEKQVKSAIAEAKYGLAQISLEAGRYEDSANDFTECLDIYKQIIEDPNSRVIAEGHYNIALALSFDKKYDDAIKGFETSIEKLKARASQLKEQAKAIEDKSEAEHTDDEKVKLKDLKDEILEINDLIMFDLIAKIEDATEGKKLLENTKEQVKDAIRSSLSEFDSGFDKPTQDEVVHDCTSKVRSVKRKSDDELEDGNEKKVRSENIGGKEVKESNAA